jgi:hypothetical protein
MNATRRGRNRRRSPHASPRPARGQSEPGEREASEGRKPQASGATQ